MLYRFLRDQNAGSAAEYALILAAVGVGLGAASLVLGNNVTYAVDQSATDFQETNVATSGDGTNASN